MAQNKRAAGQPKAAGPADTQLHEVLVQSPTGHQSVHRVVATSKAEAERFVAQQLGLGTKAQSTVVDVASPADLRKREQEAQRQVSERLAVARRESQERGG